MTSSERDFSTDDLEEINRRLSMLERRMARQERNYGLLVATLPVAIILIIVALLFLPLLFHL